MHFCGGQPLAERTVLITGLAFCQAQGHVAMAMATAMALALGRVCEPNRETRTGSRGVNTSTGGAWGFRRKRDHRDRGLVLILDIFHQDRDLVLDIDREPRSSSRY